MLLAARDDRARLRPSRMGATHRSLLPTAWLLGRGSGISVVCHGNDVWGGGHLARRSLEARLMRGAGVRVVAVSSFTAGALSRVCHASVLPPGLSREWFDMLVRESSRSRACGRGTRLVTTFRLAQWRSKGLPQLLEAVAALGRSDLRVTVCGVGPPPEDLQRRVRQDNLCVLRAGLSDRELACELAAADLFVLATRTVTGRRPSGEGFGVALLEAQVAGTPVIGPAYGGSHDAFVGSVTGVAPRDESAGALAAVLAELLSDRAELADMGRRAADWARARFAPDQYAKQAVERLL